MAQAKKRKSTSARCAARFGKDTNGYKRCMGFAKVAKAANQLCHRDTNSVDKYRACMRKEMKANLPKSKKKATKKAASKMLKCKGIVGSGKKKGKLKKGFKWAGKGKCPKAVAKKK